MEEFMKTPLKTWFLYGTLFSALGFTISGNDPKLEGYEQFSSNERIPNAQQFATAFTEAEKAKLKAAAAAKKTGTTPAATTTAPITTTQPDAKPSTVNTETAPVEVEVTADTTATTVSAPASATVTRTEVQRGNSASTDTRQAPGRVTTTSSSSNNNPTKFEDYSVFIESKDGKDGKSYQISLAYGNGKTRVMYYDKAEGRECNGECAGLATVKYFNSENIAAIKAQLERETIPQHLFEARKKKSEKSTDTAKSDKEGEDTEKAEKTKGEKLLAKEVDQKCSHLSDNSELECKVKKFVAILKADKRSARSKKDKKERTITDGEASSYFEANLKDYLKEMLTHNYQARVLSSLDPLQRIADLEDIREDKRKAEKERSLAKNMIRDLLREIDSEYKETRKEVGSLYKYALEAQASEVAANRREMLTAQESNDMNGYRTGMASFLENFKSLNGLTNDLYGSMNDGLDFARRNGLIDSDIYGDITKEMRAIQI
jgi:hypothetical protein